MGSLIVTIGDRRATYLGHYESWEHAMWAANYEAFERNRRCIVARCLSHKKWTVWRLG